MSSVELTSEQRRERKLAYMREWYSKNRERQIALVGKWQKANRERSNETKRAYVARNPDRRRDQALRHEAKPEIRAKRAAYRASSPIRKEYQKARNQSDIQTLSDVYVRRVMAQHLSIKGSELPQCLVDAHRELMRLKRELYENR